MNEVLALAKLHFRLYGHIVNVTFGFKVLRNANSLHVSLSSMTLFKLGTNKWKSYPKIFNNVRSCCDLDLGHGDSEMFNILLVRRAVSPFRQVNLQYTKGKARLPRYQEL